MNYPALLTAITTAHAQAQAGAAGAVNRHLIRRNWLIGGHLVEFEQRGGDRAKYGTGLLKRVSADLQARKIPGCAVRMLERMRVFYLTCPQVRELISSPPVTLLGAAGDWAIPAPPVAKSAAPTDKRLPRPLSPENAGRLWLQPEARIETEFVSRNFQNSRVASEP